MPIELKTPKTTLSSDSERRISRHLERLERRLVNFNSAEVAVTVKDRATERRYTADVHLRPGVDSTDLISHQQGDSPEQAVRQAVEDIERQLERYIATLRGEAAFGTPSRREPRETRPVNAAAVPDDDDYDAPAAL
jgi:ribosome-associated translation inhibitor RaiA